MCQSLLLDHLIDYGGPYTVMFITHTTVFRQSGELSHQRLEISSVIEHYLCKGFWKGSK